MNLRKLLLAAVCAALMGVIATASDQMISDTMATYLTNPAKHSNPNSNGMISWEAFSYSNPIVIYLSQSPHAGAVLSEEGLEDLEAYFAWRRTPAGEAAVRSSEASASEDTVKTGIAAKKPVFGGACKICPWGTMAEVVQAAMKPYGYDVHNVWKAYEVPLHPGAARYYKERGYMKLLHQSREKLNHWGFDINLD